MHSVLARQLRRLGLDLANPPPNLEVWSQLLERINAFYDDADRSRYLMERSLEMSSAEMAALHRAQRQRAASEIERSQSGYRTLFMSSPVAIWEEDFTGVSAYLAALKRQGVKNLPRYLDENPDEIDHMVSLISVTNVNDAAVELFEGQSAEDLLGQMEPNEIQDKDNMVAQLVGVWTGADRMDLELSATTFGGKPIHGVLYWRVPRIGARRDLSRVMIAITDITERVQAEARMQELVRSKDEFLASVSHELRTPLTSVYGTAEAMLEQWRDLTDGEKLELLMLISVESRDLAHLIEDLLVAARADIEKVVVQKIPVSIRKEVDAVLEAIRVEKGVVLDSSSIDGWVMADPLRFRQIIRNLVNNAIRYGGDRIRIESSTRIDGGYLYVWDDGPGIADEMREAVFEPYSRGHQPDGLAGSVGLGLTISRKLAQLMGGDLTYAYRAGWSVFTVQLPLHVDLEAA